jgi:hypothetical protein
MNRFCPPLAASGLALCGLGVAGLPVEAFDTPGPVVCTTTLEAPVIVGRGAVNGPVEVTRCGVVRTTSELVTNRYYSWRAPYARGVGVVNQITDLFGIAMGGGREGNRVMGFGFPDQGITWDGSAIENTAAWLLAPVTCRASSAAAWRNRPAPPPAPSPTGRAAAAPRRATTALTSRCQVCGNPGSPASDGGLAIW